MRIDDGRFLAPDDPVVQALALPNERILPVLDVVDWWDHPGEQGRTLGNGMTGVPRQLVVTTLRVLILRDGSVERSVAIPSIGGATLLEPPEFPLKDSERAVLVTSGGEQGMVWGCWSTATEEAERLMNELFILAHEVDQH